MARNPRRGAPVTRRRRPIAAIVGTEAVGSAGGISSSAADGTAISAAVGSAGTIAASINVPDAIDVLWENVRAHGALMQATLRNGPPQRPVGPGHNGGPEFAPNGVQELLATNHLIGLLSEDGPRNRSSIIEIKQAAEVAADTASTGRKAIAAFALGMVAGAGKAVGERATEALLDSTWWIAFYAQLADLAAAVITWAQLILSSL